MLKEWMTMAEDLAANTGDYVGDLDDAELSALLRVAAGVFAAARVEVLARQDDERTEWVGVSEFEALLQDDDDEAMRDLLVASDLLDSCELALIYIEDGAPRTAAARLRAAIAKAYGKS
jgi:hypothetical protein